jgi:carbonic anhydrase
MIFGTFKVVVISLVIIFIIHRLILYVKTMYVDTTLASSALQDSKKMYEDIARTVSSSDEKKQGRRVEINEEKNKVQLIPTRSEVQNASIKGESVSTTGKLFPGMSSSVLDMKNELTNFMDTLSQ